MIIKNDGKTLKQQRKYIHHCLEIHPATCARQYHFEKANSLPGDERMEPYIENAVFEYMIAIFFLSVFSFTNIHDSQDSWGRVRLSF